MSLFSALTPELPAALEALRAKYDVPALAAASFGSGSIRESAVVGRRKYDDPTPATLNDAFHLGSCTKSMTATLIAMAVDEKKLEWETTLATLFPEYARTTRPEFRTVTVRQLLNQRSGFLSETWPAGSPPDWRRAPGSLSEQRSRYVKLALADAPANPPGTTFLYSNRNYIVAGSILETLTRTPWETWIEQRLFRPLAMTTAGFGAPATPPSKVDAPWPHVVRDGRHVPIPPGVGADNPAVLGPAGTVRCSIEDWARYGLFHLSAARGQSRRLSPAVSRELYTPPKGSEYACGWGVANRSWGGGTVLSHNGSNTMNFAVIWLAPLRDFGVVAAVNQGNAGADAACDAVASLLIERYRKI